MKFDPKDIVEQLRHNLERYPYGDGFTVFRELLQNADDAEAESVALNLLDGWPDAANPLLQGPGLLLVNDGNFNAHSAEGMQTFGGSVKAQDQNAVGRFGLGQKSVFHLCDAFVVVPDGFRAGHEAFVVNPFETLGQPGDDCLHWKDISASDALLVAAAGAQRVASVRRLNLWFPLRRRGLRPKPRSNGIHGSDIAPESLRPLADRWRLAEMLASLRHVRRIAIEIAGVQVAVDRGDTGGMAGYGMDPGERDFFGALGTGIFSLGRECREGDDFRRDLRQSENWPRSRSRTTDEEEPQKATPHGAAILLIDPEGQSELSADWSVLLPVTRAMPARSRGAQGRMKLLLHGCFFVDSGRKAIVGLDGANDETSAEARLRADWNRALRDMLVLPLITGVLHDALTKKVLTGDALATAVTEVANCDFGRTHRAAIASRHSLARVLDVGKDKTPAHWRLVPVEAKLRPLPGPDGRGRVAFADLVSDLVSWAAERGLTLVSGPEAVLAPTPPKWEPDELAALLAKLEPAVFGSEVRTRTLADFLAIAASDDELRRAPAGVVLELLRQALASDRPVARHDGISQVLSAIDCGRVVALPPAAFDRRVLRALAAAQDGPVGLPQAWLPDGITGRSNLTPEEALPLVTALQPLLKNEKQAEAAGAAALGILYKLRRLGDAFSHPQLRELPVVRALDGRGSRILSLGEVKNAEQSLSLFRDTPFARKRLGLLIDALPDRAAFILTSALTKVLEEATNREGDQAAIQLADLSIDAACALVQKAETFGPSPDRGNLLKEIFTEEPAHRISLRILAAGDRRAVDQRLKLVALPDIAAALDTLIERLLAESTEEALIPTAIMEKLDRGKARHLLITTLERQDLGALLVRHADRLETCDLRPELSEAILLSGIPDEHLRILPILPTAGGGWAQPSRVHRYNSAWPLPTKMEALVPMLAPLANPEARRKAEELIHPWSPEAQIALGLDQAEPSLFALEILAALAKSDRPDADRLRRKPWLCDRHDRPWKPEDVLDLPEEVLAAARKTLGDDLPFLPASDLSSAIREHAGYAALRDKGVLPDSGSSLDRLFRKVEATKPVAYFGEVTEELANALAELARAGIDLPLSGWPMLKALLPGSNDCLKLVIMFATVEKGNVKGAQNWLGALSHIAANQLPQAGDHTKLKKATRRVFDNGFQQLCAWDRDQIEKVLSGVLVPVADGAWRSAQETVARVYGVAPSHRLADEIESFWPRPDTERSSEVIRHAVPAPVAGTVDGATSHPISSANVENECARSLDPVIRRLAVHLPIEAAALLVGIVRRTKVFNALARSHGMPESAVDRIWNKLRETEEVSFVPQQPGQSLANIRQKTFLLFELTRAQTIEVETLTGERRTLPADALEPLTVIGDGHRRRSSLEQDGAQSVFLRQVTISDAEAPVETRHFERLLRTVAQECLGFQDRSLDALRPQIDECLKVEQRTVEDARARLEDRLPHLLAELKPERGTEPRRLLVEYEAAEQSLAPEDRLRRMPDAKRKLWNGLLAPQASSQMLGLIRGGIARYGYGTSRVIFELFQNADDASRQNRPEFTPEARFDLADNLFRTVHWGRLINDLGNDNAEGERNRWQQDLFNMLVFNLSEKREDVTGRFGLGFKSVHLIARDVGIASRYVSCRIRGGMLPEVWDGGRQLSFEATREGRRATVIELVIDPDRQHEAKEAREAFRRCARWLPATARAIREIELDGKRFVTRFADTSKAGIRHVAFEGVAPGHALALELTPDATLFLSLCPDGPEPLPEGLPRLWLLAPIEEECRAGWLLNAYSFHVDPGRGRLSGSVEDRANLFRGLGAALGHRLVELYDLIEADWSGFAASAGLLDMYHATGQAKFLERLVRLFDADVARDSDDIRLETHLHVEGGLKNLFLARTALPTGLPRPFAPFLRADAVCWQIAGALTEPSRLARLTGWRAIEEIGHAAVCPESAKLLDRLGFKVTPKFGAGQLMRVELGTDKRADPQTASRLGAFFDEALVNPMTGDELQGLLSAAAEALFQMADGRWRKAHLPPRCAAKADEEEHRILAFAPDSAVAHSAYRAEATVFFRLAARQSGFQRKAETFASWAHDLTEPAARQALLAYVVAGEQGERLGALLAQRRPHWLPDTADGLRQSALLSGLDDEMCGRLMTMLYPSLARSIATGKWPPFDFPGSEPKAAPLDPAGELDRILDWWRAEHLKNRVDYDDRIWPQGFRPRLLVGDEAAEDREGWFTFFALGIFRTLPWNNEGAHKSYIEGAQREGWWQEMASAQLPDDFGPWLKRLEDFARPDSWNIGFPQWRRTIADLYALARWLPDYADAFRQLPRVVEREGKVSLSDLWRPGYAPVWQRRGLEGAPLTQSLGLGANWMIREAIRHDLWPEDEARLMYPYGWAATARLRRLFEERLGHPIGERGNMDISPTIFEFVEGHLGPDAATFLGDLDLPLQLWNDNLVPEKEPLDDEETEA